MTGRRYLDLDLYIQRVGGGSGPARAGRRAEGTVGGAAWPSRYRAEARGPSGQGALEFRLPFSELEIENLFLKLGRPQAGTRRVESPQMQAVRTFGARLFNIVFAGDVRGCFEASRQAADDQRAGLRVRLHLADVPELADLPWEYLHNPGLNDFLALSA